MKKLILPIIVFLILVFSSSVYAAPEETTPLPKSSSGYDPKCWNTHMIDEIAVCNKAYLSCIKPCPFQDLKANAICLNACSKVHTDCLKSASAAYKVCIEAERQAQKQQEIKQVKPFNIFGINPYQMWLNLIDLAQLRALMGTGALDRFTESTILHSAGRETSWEKDARKEEEINKFYAQVAERFLKLKGKTAWTDINDATKKILIESIKDSVTIKKGSALIELQPLSEEKGVLETGSIPMLKSGAVDVIFEPQNSEQFQIQTPNVEILVIGTEFSVIYDSKNNETMVAVYKGKVEVKTKDGKTTTVSPNGDKPGVIVVTQKLSITKLTISGAVLIVIISGVVFFLKRKKKKVFGRKK